MSDDIQWETIKELKEDLKTSLARIDQKLDRNSEAVAMDRATLYALVQQVDILTQIITRGNGQPSLLARVESIQTSLKIVIKATDTLKADHEALKSHAGIADNVGVLAAEAQKTKWATLGKIAGIIALAIPGILSYFGF